MATIEKVKLLVLGDSGVGKSSLTHLICHKKPLLNPSWTVGCSVDVKLHEFREGLSQQRSFYLEFWDVGGSVTHRNTRNIFYNGAHGIILVHDLSNRKSQVNLRMWLSEVLSFQNNPHHYHYDADQLAGLDSEQLVGTGDYENSNGAFLPVLVIGTKVDVAVARSRKEMTFAEGIGADEIVLDCLSTNALAAGSSAAVKLSRFFDRAIQGKLNRNNASNASNAGSLMMEKRSARRLANTVIRSTMANNTNRLYHMD